MKKNNEKLTVFLICLFLILTKLGYSQQVTIPANYTFFNGTTPTASTTITTPVTSDKINNAIIAFGNAGGTIKIPAGTHNLNKVINVKSNIYIEINKEATLKPTSAFFMFDLGTRGRGTQQKISNVKIYAPSGKFTIDYSNFGAGDKVSAFTIGYVENFLIEGVFIKDNQTFLSGFSLSPPSGGNWNRIAKNGIIRNCSITNSDYGYGLVQVQAAKNVLFKNLKGYGGVTLRLESGWKLMRNAGVNVATSTKLYGMNITGINGNAAVMVSPHTKNQGFAVIKNVTSRNCSFGMRIDKGFDEDGYPAGKYKKVVIGGEIKVTRNSNETKHLAQIKQKHYGFYPEAFRNSNPFSSFVLTGGTDPLSKKAPSIAGLLFDAQNTATDWSGTGKYKVTFRTSGHVENTQTYTGFRSCSPNIVYDNDKNNVCTNAPIAMPLNTLDIDYSSTENYNIKIYTNNNKLIELKHLEIGSKIVIVSLASGKVIKTIISKSSNETINPEAIAEGLYVISIHSKNGTTTQKIIL